MTPVKSTGLLAVNTAIATRPCLIHGITIVQAAAACTGIVYDNATTNSGTAVMQANNTVNVSTNNGPQLPYPVECLNGAYVAITGTGANVIVYYSLL